MKVQAINPKHQTSVNKCVQWMEKYEKANDMRNMAEDNTECDYLEDDKEWRKWNRQCERAYDKYLDYTYDLPKRELDKVEKAFQL